MTDFDLAIKRKCVPVEDYLKSVISVKFLETLDAEVREVFLIFLMVFLIISFLQNFPQKSYMHISSLPCLLHALPI